MLTKAQRGPVLVGTARLTGCSRQFDAMESYVALDAES